MVAQRGGRFVGVSRVVVAAGAALMLAVVALGVSDGADAHPGSDVAVARRTVAPIVGTWTNATTGGVVVVRAVGGGRFDGVVTKAWISTNAEGTLHCRHPLSQVVWSIKQQSSTHYTGTNRGFEGRLPCTEEVQATTWDVTSKTSFTMHSVSPSGKGKWTVTYTRPTAPEPGNWVTVPFSFSGTQHSSTFYATIVGKGVVRAAKPGADGMSDDVRFVSASITLRYAPKPNDIRGAYVIGLRFVPDADGKLEGATYDATRKELRRITLAVASSASPDCVVGIKGWVDVLSETGHNILIRPSSWAFCGDKATYTARSFQWYGEWATVQVG